MPSFKPLTDIARWTRIMLFACAAFYALSAAALPGNLENLDLLEAELARQQPGTQIQWVESADFAGVGLAAFLITTIVFLVFFHRAYSNLAVLGPGEQRYGAGWSVGSWFIPILNIFRPKQIANDIWRGSDGSPVPAVFHWWWLFWLLGGFAEFGYNKEAVTVEQARTVVIVQTWGEVFLVVAALTGAAVVKLIARRQELRASLIGEQQRAEFMASPERIAPQLG